MVAIPSFWDERKLFVFIALIIVAAAATLLEIDAMRDGRQNLVDEFTATVLTPVEGTISGAARGIGGELSAVGHAGALASQNEALSDKVTRLAANNDRIHGALAENADLRRLLAMHDRAGVPSVAAEVVGYVPESGRLQIAIDRGSVDGVKRDDVVVGATGLVGHVIAAGPHEAQVLLVIDPTSSVPAYLERTRAWGIVVGTSAHIKMKYIAQEKHVVAGDLVVTGRGQIYPGGIAIGRVREVDKKDSALYQTAVLDTEVDFGSLADVLVLKTQ